MFADDEYFTPVYKCMKSMRYKYPPLSWPWYSAADRRVNLQGGWLMAAWAPFYVHGLLTLFPAWISIHMISKASDEITYPFQTFLGN